MARITEATARRVASRDGTEIGYEVVPGQLVAFLGEPSS
jgi:hypothetical protein